MEYFIVILNNKPVKITETLLEALVSVDNKDAVIHRIHSKDDKLVVQEIKIQLAGSTSSY
jgi:hypothetical protein